MNYLFDPAPAKDVADWIRQKLPLSRQQFDKLLPELQARAFVVSGVHAFDALQDIRDTVAKLPEGELFKSVQKEVAAKLSNYINYDQPDLFDDIEGFESTSDREKLERRAGFLLRHHGNQAYAYAAHADLEEHADIFTHWKYLTVGDGHVRDTHRALDGLILPKTHEFWQTHFPPWGYGCRCQVVPVTTKEYDEYVKLDAGKELADRYTLTDAEQLRLTNERKLQRKIGGVETDIDLRADAEKGAEFPYIFDPGNFKLPLSSIESRYDATVWKSFTAWAQSEKLQGNQTVWSWLGGSITTPTTSVADLMQQLNMDEVTPVSIYQVQSMLEELKEVKPVKAADAFSEVRGNKLLSKASMLDAAQPFFNMLPPALVQKLPKLKYVAVNKPKSANLGSYNPQTQTLEINAAHLHRGVQGDLKVIIMHELVHWAHIQSSTVPTIAHYFDDIKAFFNVRVKGESLKTLHPYAKGTKGYADEFAGPNLDEYAGRVYTWENADNAIGYELPTVHLEKISYGPSELTEWLNYRHPASNRLAWREAFLKSLELFYLRP